jgi:geranylgeranyl diphosphate synthase, type II
MNAARINQVLSDVLGLYSHHDQLILDVVRQTVLSGGSRIRPLLFTRIVECMRVARLSDLRIACAFEILHASSLILDDLPCMDNSPERRSQRSCHVLYGGEIVNLAAAWMQFYATSLIADSLAQSAGERAGHCEDDSRVFEWLVNAIDRALSGQMLDLRGRVKSQRGILRVYSLKTGAIFECIAKTAAYVGGATSAEIRLLGRFGNIFGIAYQLRDDLSDNKNRILNPKERSFVTLWGEHAALEEKEKLTDRLATIVSDLGDHGEHLLDLQAIF